METGIEAADMNDLITIPNEMASPIDILGRGPFVDQVMEIISILSKSRRSCTFAINGSWGAGKTFVLDMLKHRLQDHKAGTQYLVFDYNCWQYDYYDEPLIAIVSSMLDSINQQTKLISPEAGVAGHVMFNAAKPVVERIATSFAKKKLGIDVKELLEVMKDGKEEVQKALERAEELYSYDTYYNFREKLSQAREELLNLSKDQTVVIVVDELDRCQPDYAITVLERLHHFFFGLENIIVIMSVDRKQLDKTVTHIFGDGTNVNSYLRKFINFEIELDAGKINASFRDKFLEYVSLFNESVFGLQPTIDRYLSALFSGLDARTQEQLILKTQTIHKLLYETKEKDLAFMCFELLLTVFFREESEHSRAPFYYEYDKKKEGYVLLVNSSLPKPLQSYISDEWNFRPGILQDGRGRFPMFESENLDIPRLLIVYSSLLYGHGIRVDGMDEMALQDTISNFRNIIQLFEVIK